MPNTHSIKRSQKIPIGLNAAWNFFSKPDNLKRMTPDNIHFQADLLSNTSIYSGQIIDYKMKTRFGFSIKWITEIVDVEEKKYFIDEQRTGPFKFWRHQHFFIEIPGGILMTDIINYECRFGRFAPLLNRIYFKHRINQIYNHRAKQIISIFGEYIDPEYNYNPSLMDNKSVEKN